MRAPWAEKGSRDNAPGGDQWTWPGLFQWCGGTGWAQKFSKGKDCNKILKKDGLFGNRWNGKMAPNSFQLTFSREMGEKARELINQKWFKIYLFLITFKKTTKANHIDTNFFSNG